MCCKWSVPMSEMNQNKWEIFLVNVFPPNERRVIRMRICIIFSIHPSPYSLIRPSPFLLIPPSLYPLIWTSNFLTTTMLIVQIHCQKKSYGLINLNDQRQFNLSNTLIKESMVNEWFIYFFSWPKVCSTYWLAVQNPID